MSRPWTIHTGDCRDALAAMDAESIDACVTDTPYGLSTILDPANLDREALWQKINAGESELPIVRLLRSWLDTGENPIVKGRGFMGKEWDALVPPPNTWRALWRVMKPGAYLFAFGGSRTSDLISMSIRLAGFEVEDNISYLFGSGFPKRVRLDLAIDTALGMKAQRPIHGPRPAPSGTANIYGAMASRDEQMVTGAATPEAARFVGHDRALRPGNEPIIVAEKPRMGTVAANAMRYGTGGLNVDGCRIPRETIPAFNGGERSGTGGGIMGPACPRGPTPENNRGGYPANVILEESTLQVLRLKGSLPAEVKETVRSYFNAGPVSSMRGRVFHPAEQGGGREGKVLLSGVLRETLGSDHEGRWPLHVREKAPTGNDRVDEQEAKGVRCIGEGTSPVQDGDVRQWLQVHPHQHNDRADDGTVQVDDREGHHFGASDSHGDSPRQGSDAQGDRPPSERNQDRQPFGEPGVDGQRDTQARASGDRQGTPRASCGERGLEVTADVVPAGWLHLFEYTGRDVVDPNCPARELDRQAGYRHGPGAYSSQEYKTAAYEGGFKANMARTVQESGGGGASRFFYTAKASTSERDKGLEDLPTLTPGKRSGGREEDSAGINGYAGTRGENGRNPGPCVKPISLMRYLVRLASPPGAHDPDISKRPVILDIFAGSGSTLVAGLVEGVRVVGCELDPEMSEVARRRCQHAYALPAEDETDRPTTRVGGQSSLAF
jgi:DNA modification methylase